MFDQTIREDWSKWLRSGVPEKIGALIPLVATTVIKLDGYRWERKTAKWRR